MIIKKLIPMRQILTAILFLSSIFFCRGQEDDIRRTVAFLADSVGCRYPASDGDIKVRDFLARQFRECGMKCEVQTFDIVEYMWGDGTLQLIEDTDTTDFILGTDFAVSSHSPTEIPSGTLVLTGGEGALSDHLDFSAAGIATSFFTTGEDPLIHTTEDTSDRLDYGSMDRITDFLADYILAIDKADS